MSIEDKRKLAFEKYALAHFYLREISFKRNESHLGEYDDPELDLAWEAWNAALDSVVIELPAAPAIDGNRENYTRTQSAYHQGMMAVIKAIVSSGLKVRS